MAVTLRPVQATDQDFLFRLYASTRQNEFAGVGWSGAQLELFLRMQFSAQQRWYGTAYAGAVHQMVMLDQSPIGRLLVHHGPKATVLVDISLLSEHRGHGIGGGLLRELLEQCGRKQMSLQLQVLRTNPALRLYERLGFVKTGEDQLYFQMEKKPA